MSSNHLILCCPLLLLPSIIPASGSFPMSQFLAPGGKSIGPSASVLSMNIQDSFPLGLMVWSSCSPRESPDSYPAPQFKSTGLIHGSGIFLGEGHGNSLQYSCLENPMEKGTQWAIVHAVAQSRTQLKQLSRHAYRIYTYTNMLLFLFFWRALTNAMSSSRDRKWAHLNVAGDGSFCVCNLKQLSSPRFRFFPMTGLSFCLFWIPNVKTNQSFVIYEYSFIS